MWAKTPLISFSAHWNRPPAHKKLGAERSWFNVGSASQMVAQHSTSIGPTSHNHLTYCALQRVHGVWSSEVMLYKSYPAYMVAILSDGCTFYVTICRLTTYTTACLQVIMNGKRPTKVTVAGYPHLTFTNFVRTCHFVTCDLSKIDHYFVPAQTTLLSTPENLHQSDVTLPEDPADITQNGNGDKMIFKRCLFEYNMGKHSTSPITKEWTFRKCAVFFNTARKMNNVCIFSHDLGPTV